MKIIKNVLFVAMILMMGIVDAKNVGGVQPGQQPTTPRTGVIQEPQPIYIPRQQPQQRQPQQLGRQQQQPTPLTSAEVDALFNEIMAASVPWNQTIQNKYNDARAKNLFSTAQEYALQLRYNNEMKRLGLLQPKEQGPSLESFKQVQMQPATTQEGGIIDRIKAWWSGKSKGEALAQATPWAALAASAAGISLAPVVLTGLGAAAATFAVSSALDQANFVQKSGGYWSTKTYKDRLKEDMALLLNDQGAYPYFVSRLEAVKNNNELYPTIKDPFGIGKDVLNGLNNELINKSNALSTDQRKRENTFAQVRDSVRSKYNYSNLTPEEYIRNIETDLNALIQAQALVSEYSRARNKINVQEEAKKAAQQAQAAQASTQTPVQQQPAQSTTTTQTVTQ